MWPKNIDPFEFIEAIIKSGIKNIELKPINVKNEYHFSLELLSLGKKELIIKSALASVGKLLSVEN